MSADHRDDDDLDLDLEDDQLEAGDELGDDADEPDLADGTGVDLPALSRKVRRRRRRSRPRSKTIAMKRLTREELRIGALLYPPVDIPRPTTREQCRGEARPCPWVACKHHLYLDVNPETGSIKINFPDLEPWELQHTCALDVAERGGITLEEVGEIMNLTRERIRQVEVRGLLKLKMGSPSPDELGSELLAQAALAKNERN
jgi:sigma-70-like protein